MQVDKLFVATKAFILYEGKVLILRESKIYPDGSKAGKYVVPGGRIEPGQRFDDSLRREIREETGLEVIIGKPFYVTEWRPVVRGEQWQVVGTFFKCDATSNNVTLSDEHDSYLWIDPETWTDYPEIEELEQQVFKAYLQQ